MTATTITGPSGTSASPSRKMKVDGVQRRRRRTTSVVPASLRPRRRSTAERGRRSASDGVVTREDDDGGSGDDDGDDHHPPPIVRQASRGRNGSKSRSRRSMAKSSDTSSRSVGGRGRSRSRSRSRGSTKSRGRRKNLKGGDILSSRRQRPLGSTERRRLALIAREMRRRATASSASSFSSAGTTRGRRGREEGGDVATTGVDGEDGEDGGAVEMDVDKEEEEDGDEEKSSPSKVAGTTTPRTPPTVRRRRRRVARVVPASLRRRTRRNGPSGKPAASSSSATTKTKTAGGGGGVLAATTAKPRGGKKEAARKVMGTRKTSSIGRRRASSATGPPSVQSTPSKGGKVTPDATTVNSGTGTPRRSSSGGSRRRRLPRGEISKLCDSWLGPDAEDVPMDASSSFEEDDCARGRPAGRKIVTPSPASGSRSDRGTRRSQRRRIMNDEVSRLCDSWLGPTAEDLAEAMDAETLDADSRAEEDHEGVGVDHRGEAEGAAPTSGSNRRSRYFAREVRKMKADSSSSSPETTTHRPSVVVEDEEMTAWDGGGGQDPGGKSSSSSEVIVVEDDAITTGFGGGGNGEVVPGAPSGPSAAAAASATPPRDGCGYHENSSSHRHRHGDAAASRSRETAGAVGLPLEELVALERRMEGKRSDLGLLADEQAEVVQRMTQLQAELGPLTRSLMDHVSSASASASGGTGAAMPSVARSYERHIGWTRGELNTLARDQIDIVNRMSAIKEDLNEMQKEMYELVTLEHGSGVGFRSQRAAGDRATMHDAGHDDGKATKSEEAPPPKRGTNSSRAKSLAIGQGNASDKKRGAVVSTTTDGTDLRAGTIMSGSSTLLSSRTVKLEKDIGTGVVALESGVMHDRGGRGGEKGDGDEHEPVENVDSLSLVATSSRRATLRSHGGRGPENKSNRTKNVVTVGEMGKKCVSPTSDGEDDELHGKVTSEGDDALSSISSPPAREGTMSKKVTGGEKKRKRPSRACTRRKVSPNATAEAASPTPTGRPYKRRRRPFRRCGTCVACLSDFCGTCKGCLDMRRFGGSKRWNTGCIRRKCLSPLPPRSDTASKSTVRSESVSLRRVSRPSKNSGSPPLVSIEGSDTRTKQRHDRIRPTEAFHPSHEKPLNAEPLHVDADVKSLSDGLVGEDISDFDDVEVERIMTKKGDSENRKDTGAHGGSLSSLSPQNMGEPPLDEKTQAGTGPPSNLPKAKMSTASGGSSPFQEKSTDNGKVVETERQNESTKHSRGEPTEGETPTPRADAADSESLCCLPQPKLSTGSSRCAASPTRTVGTSRNPSAAELAREFRELQRNFRQVDPYALSDEDDYCYLLPPPFV